MVHPLNSFCGEDCLLGALVIAISFSLLNIQIYNFFIGQPFYIGYLTPAQKMAELEKVA
jgi:hypothetical protein